MGDPSVSSWTAEGQITIRVNDVDQLTDSISGAELQVVQLRSGPLDATIRHRSVGDFSVDQGLLNLPLRVRGSLDTRRYSVGVFRPGPGATYNGNRVDDSTLLYFMPNRELDGYHRDVHGWTTLVIPDEWMDAMLRAARQSHSLQLPTDCRLFRPDPHKLADLQQAADALMAWPSPGDCASGGSDWAGSHVRNALGAALSALDSPLGREARHTLAHFRIARKAELYMRERLDEALCIDDVCIALRVSRRYLEYAFNDALGTTPSRYLRLLRLNAVRRRLKGPDAGTTVTHEAMRLGFNHLGLFSVQYKKAFGESPSATLSAAMRARGSAPK